MEHRESPAPTVIDLDGLGELLALLGTEGYDVIGPRVEDGVIDYASLTSVGDLPVGWSDDQQPGRYRIAAPDGSDPWVFGFATAASSPKRQLHPPRELLVSAIRTPSGEIRFDEPIHDEPPLALVGVKACELHAIAIQDRVLLGGDHPDPAYAGRRDACLVIAVECSHPSGTCFCASMAAGPDIDTTDPDVAEVADLVLTELPPVRDARGQVSHLFVVRAPSARGRQIAGRIEARAATDDDVTTARSVVDEAARHMGRTVDASTVHDVLLSDPEHPAWDAVADRCLSCTNCTLVCPTCFCTSTEETTSLDGGEASRWRAPCFSLSFSHLHGGSVRTTTRSRYRQWATHKLATWQDQFGTSGCVGCGRCITWCPAGIDLTETARSLAQDVHGTASLLGAGLAEGMSR